MRVIHLKPAGPMRWRPGLGGKARVIEEGQNGRTTVFDDETTFESRNGSVALPLLLISHQPLDLVIMMLGTNDIKFAARCRAFDASMGMERLIQIVKERQLREGFQDTGNPYHVAAQPGADAG